MIVEGDKTEGRHESRGITRNSDYECFFVCDCERRRSLNNFVIKKVIGLAVIERALEGVTGWL